MTWRSAQIENKTRSVIENSERGRNIKVSEVPAVVTLGIGERGSCRHADHRAIPGRRDANGRELFVLRQPKTKMNKQGIYLRSRQESREVCRRVAIDRVKNKGLVLRMPEAFDFARVHVCCLAGGDELATPEIGGKSAYAHARTAGLSRVFGSTSHGSCM
jgi:hypothetical protein